MEPTTSPGSDPHLPEPQPLAPARPRLTLVFLTVVAVGLIVGGFARTADAPTPLAGQVAAEVVLERFDGGTWRLSEHLATDGRPVVLNLYASWCLPCRDEIPELSAFAEARPDVLVVGVAVRDERSAALDLVEELQPSYLVGLDATDRLRDAYPSAGMPFTVYIDPGGVIRWDWTGGVTAEQLAEVVPGA